MSGKSKIVIGFLGMGTVAQGVWKHMSQSRERMLARMGVEYELGKVGVRNPDKARAVEIPSQNITSDLMSVATAPDVDIVCELIGGIDDALKYTLVALEKGKIVVSANKALICKHGDLIAETARKFGGIYFFEASVAGGIPIIKTIREGLVANKFSKIFGILNGTCNYILTRMELEHASCESIIEDARRLGYVEADESLDLDGWDAAHKISILTYLAHGMRVQPEQMDVEGIREVRLEDMLWARENGYRLKLIASVYTVGEGAITVSVRPALLPLSNPVANVDDVFNAVSLTGDVVGTTVHIGRGAGQDATASAVIADIVDAARALKCGAQHIKTPEVPVKLASDEEIFGEYYLRLEAQDEAGVLASIASIFAKSNISIELLEQKKHSVDGKAWILLTTHNTSAAEIKRACKELENLPSVFGKPFVLKILD